MSADQRSFFRNVERDWWATADGLKPDEAALIASQLRPDALTLEAGTGGGRIVRAMHELGFARLVGFDFAPELIDAARAAARGTAIRFEVADATALPYADASFDQLVYLQQIVCTIESAAARRAALAEAARVLRPGGVALFSFLCFEGRRRVPLQGAYVAYLRGLRLLRRSPRSLQLMPRLRSRGRLNGGALRDAGPYTYWYRVGEAERELRRAGFAIRALASSADVAAGHSHASAGALLANGAVDSTLYAVCAAPEA